MSIKKSILFILIAEALIALLAVYHYGYTLEGLQATTRFSGRLSLAIFSVMFIFLPRNRDKLYSLLSPRPFLIFAFAHGIHLVQLLAFVYLSNADLIPVRLAGGFLAYVFIFIMPLLHTYSDNGKISPKQFNIVESIYLYYVWFIFFMSYLPRVQGKLPHVGGSYWEFVVLLSWVSILMGMKLSTLMVHRKRNSSES